MISDNREDADLLLRSRRARECAYAPYSKLRVGASVLSDDGRVFDGCNIENASSGMTICAERVAIFAAIAAGARQIQKIAVSVGDSNQKDLAQAVPCGACLQVMAEFAQPNLPILIDGVGHHRLVDLLPRPFGRTSADPG